MGDLLTGAEDVGVVLGHAPDPGQAVHHPGQLVAVDGPELEEPQRQLAVGALPALEHQDVERAVHRLEVVLVASVQLHRGEHPLGEPVEMARRLEQPGFGDVWGVDELVPGRLVALPRVVLDQSPDGASLRVEDGQPGPDLIGEGEEIQLGSDATVIPPLGLGQAVQVVGEGLLRLPRRPVDPLQLRAGARRRASRPRPPA